MGLGRLVAKRHVRRPARPFGQRRRRGRLHPRSGVDRPSIVIEAGAREGTATLKVVADDEDERSEALVLVAVAADGDEVGSLAFTLWTPRSPVLPLAAHLLLGVLLAIGAYRRHRGGRDSGVA